MKKLPALTLLLVTLCLHAEISATDENTSVFQRKTMEGAEISDPTILRSATGIQPLVVDPDNTASSDISSAAFE